MLAAGCGQVFSYRWLTLDRRGGLVRYEHGQARQFVDDLGGTLFEMVAIPAGIYQMGSAGGLGYPDEHPQHTVRVGALWMGKYAVTQEQWEAVMGTQPLCRFRGAKHPVQNIAWTDAQAFCARLSHRTGHSYRLPSEGEWEYACRAGTTTPFHCGETITTEMANYCGEHVYLDEAKGVYRHTTLEVGQFPPNAFGLYDMHGNVWEWCADPWHANYQGAPTDGSTWEAQGKALRRVARGGSWHEPPNLCRSAVRLRCDPTHGEDTIGFRVVCVL